jgi:hypothetical protein
MQTTFLAWSFNLRPTLAQRLAVVVSLDLVLLASAMVSIPTWLYVGGYEVFFAALVALLYTDQIGDSARSFLAYELVLGGSYFVFSFMSSYAHHQAEVAVGDWAWLFVFSVMAWALVLVLASAHSLRYSSVFCAIVGRTNR